MNTVYDVFKELLLTRLELLNKNEKLSASKLKHLLTICLQPFFTELSLKKLKKQYGYHYSTTYDKLRADFFLPQFKLVIEFDGEQHLKNVEHFGGKDAYYKRLQLDAIKNDFCLTNDLDIIRLAYNSTVGDFLNVLTVYFKEITCCYYEVTSDHELLILKQSDHLKSELSTDYLATVDELLDEEDDLPFELTQVLDALFIDELIYQTVNYTIKMINSQLEQPFDTKTLIKIVKKHHGLKTVTKHIERVPKHLDSEKDQKTVTSWTLN